MSHCACWRRGAFALAILAAPFHSRTAAAQGGADTAVIVKPASASEAAALGLKLIGVFDGNTGAWIARAVVRDTLGHETITSDIGVATLNALTPVAGFFVLEIGKPGYEPTRLRVRGDTTTQVLVALQPHSAATLAPVVTTAKRRMELDPGASEGFFDRCQLGAACVGPAEIARHPTARLAELLAQTPGVHRNCTDRGSANGFGVDVLGGRQTRSSVTDVSTCKITMSRVGSPPICQPYYFVNGLFWNPKTGNGDAQTQVDKAVDYSRVTGIEVYLTDQPKPPKFDVRIGGECGAIVIWMR